MKNKILLLLLLFPLLLITGCKKNVLKDPHYCFNKTGFLDWDGFYYGKLIDDQTDYVNKNKVSSIIYYEIRNGERVKVMEEEYKDGLLMNEKSYGFVNYTSNYTYDNKRQMISCLDTSGDAFDDIMWTYSYEELDDGIKRTEYKDGEVYEVVTQKKERDGYKLDMEECCPSNITFDEKGRVKYYKHQNYNKYYFNYENDKISSIIITTYDDIPLFDRLYTYSDGKIFVEGVNHVKDRFSFFTSVEYDLNEKGLWTRCKTTYENQDVVITEREIK